MLIAVTMSHKHGRHKDVRCRLDYTGQGQIFRGSMWIGDRQSGWTKTGIKVLGCDSSTQTRGRAFKDSIRDVYSARFALEPKGDFIEVMPIYRNAVGGFVFWSGDTLQISYSVYENVGEYHDPIKGGILKSGGAIVRNADERFRIPVTVSMRNARGLIVECSANPGRMISDVKILGISGPTPPRAIPSMKRMPSLPPNSDPEPPAEIRKWQDEDGNWHFTDF
ncbi:MAG: hypothetical protein EOM25_05105 [Deltaproteobacteria bacterium]|nr:hypothetical protein [Deltaproteobacteria bacterium]